MAGAVTLTKIVFVGPVLKNRQNTATKIKTQACGKSTAGTSSTSGKATSNDPPETRKYDPDQRTLSRSPSQPPAIVPSNPDTTTIKPNIQFASASAARRISSLPGSSVPA